MKDLPSKPVSLEQSFLQGYEEFSDELFRFCLVKVRNRDEALDIVQETFVRVWEYLRKGREIDHLRGFLYRTARNIIVDQSRKHSTLSLDGLHEEQNFDPATSPQAFGVGIDLERALAALNALDDPHREILTLRFLQDLEIDEIAETLSMTRNAVSVRIHRAIEALKKQTGYQQNI